MATVKSLKSDVSSVSPWSEQLEELRVVRVYIELRYWWKYGDKKTRINQLNDTVRIKSADLSDIFLS